MSRRPTFIRVIVTGLFVLVLLAVPLYWGRFWCDVAIVAGMPTMARSVEIDTDRSLPKHVWADPNIADSCASAVIDPLLLLDCLGIVDYYHSRIPGGRRSRVLRSQSEDYSDTWLYLDRATGLLTHYSRDSWPPSRQAPAWVFVGPHGMAADANDSLGRFTSPVVGEFRDKSILVYDEHARRFFGVDFRRRTVRQGPELAEGSPRFIALELPHKSRGLRFEWTPPVWRFTVPEEANEVRTDAYGFPLPAPLKRRHVTDPNLSYSSGPAEDFALVLDETGGLHLLDRKTLRLAGSVGELPTPVTFLGDNVPTPSGLLAYAAIPIRGLKGELLSAVGAGVSRQGTSVSILHDDRRLESWRGKHEEHSRAVQYASLADVRPVTLTWEDEDGVRSRSDRFVGKHASYVHSAKAALYETPYGPLLATIRYFFESLHPPILTLASYLVADHLEAGSTHRALFLQPNSFVSQQNDRARGQHYRYGRGEWGYNRFARLLAALATMMPGLVLSGILSWRVVRDAKIVGMSARDRRLWLLVTVAFGLVAYIAYRLTRPTGVLVTCANCGKGRRPDMDVCHRCGLGWELSELAAPTWRVLDDGH